MTDCAHNINELKRSHEDAMKIQEIQSMLYNFEGYNLLDFGKLIVEVSSSFLAWIIELFDQMHLRILTMHKSSL